ncbi:MAG TPA: DUF1501 domain-containing protein [Pirellulaceae bacterium]|nr:DUF1501 domain-containing protein [Pirellulaceae bacterium]HMO91169.1 DUF1501 domain-containing protein [Pirellulaceae bacterium]HMP69061.1 DUF1501 domain-containing protein [Pirellulaceae bacterium]
MKKTFQRNDPCSRRAFVCGAAKSFLGLGAMPLLSNLAHSAEQAGLGLSKDAKAKSVIYLFMNGGMSHLDTFDTKPGAETQGPVESIKTNVEGIQISEYFPRMAEQMDKVAIINSMRSTQGAHEQGRYYMHTSYVMRGTVSHPDIGAWSAFHLEKLNASLPANVKIGGNSAGLGGGFLESQFAALPIGNPEEGLKNSRLPRYISDARLARRLQRVELMNQSFNARYDNKLSRAYAQMYDDAVRLMKSEDLKAFDLNQESAEIRDRYGRNSFGQACLLARRLVEHGVRFIEIDHGGWDTHNDNFNQVRNRGAVLDQGMAALLADLTSRGMLDETLVVLATEFGRTPTIVEDRSGRNHYPQAFTCLMAGGGVKGGFRHGMTDKEGREILTQPVEIPDFNATIAHALGIPLDKEVYSPSMRPFRVADKGEPVLELFA